MEPSNASERTGPCPAFPRVPVVPADDTRRRILDAAIEVIGAGGEDTLRVADVARRAGVTQGMVTYHFITRHNLVAEAQRERYAATMRADADFLLSVTDQVHDVETLVALTLGFVSLLVSPERAALRRARINALGFAAASDDAWKAIGEVATAAGDALTTFIVAMDERGLLRDGVSPRAVATSIQSWASGLFQFDLDEQRPSTQEMVDTFESFLRSVLVG